MKRIISGLLALSLSFGAAAFADVLPQIFDNGTIYASAETDAWGREYKTYGDLRYQVLSDNTISIIGFDTSKDTANIPAKIEGKTVTQIGHDAFFQAYYLTDIKIPDTVTTIDFNAFYKCGALTSITLPSNLKTIGSRAFDSCVKLASIKIPDSVTSIGEYAFQYSGLKSIVVPDSVKAIKSKTFYNMPDLVSVTLPKNVDELGTWVFAFSDNLETVRLPENLTSIPSRTFFQCYNLKNVNIPANIKTIGEYSFYYCKELEKISVPSGVTQILEAAFKGCGKLSNVTLPNGLTKLGVWAFQDCTSIKELTIPKTVSSIGSYCFYNCNDLTLNLFRNSYAVEYAIKNEINFKTFYVDSVNSSFKASTVTNNSVKLTWNKVPDAQGYVIYKYNTTKKAWERVAKTTLNVDSYTVTGLSGGVKYTFAINAYITAIGTEVLSLEYPTTTATTLFPTVTGFKVASSSTNAIKMTWNKVSGAQGYIIYRYDPAKKTWLRLAKTTTTDNTYTATKLAVGTSYIFAVKAYKTIDSKEVSSISFPKLTASTNPATVSFTLTAGSKKAAVKWSKLSGVTGYVVYYKSSANDAWQRLTVTKNNSYLKAGLISGRTYYFTVRAYRTVAGKNYYGSFVTKSVKIK